MGLLGSLFGRNPDSEEKIRRFEEMVRLHRDQLFGISLYLQGIELMYDSQPEILELSRKSFQDIKDRAETAIAAAESLLQKARTNPATVKQIEQFEFPPISGHPMLDQMTRRAQILVHTYERMFPGRSRSQPLTEDEITSLTMEAAEQL